MKKLIILLSVGILLLCIETATFIVLNSQKEKIVVKEEPKVEQLQESKFVDDKPIELTEEEKKKQKEEEARKFAATYGPCKFIPILMYHHVGSGTNSLFVQTETFTAQMDYLKGKGYNTVTLEEVVNSLKTGAPLPAKPIVLTFDDGYRDNFDNAFPILQARGMRATIFIITQLAGGGDYLLWEQINQMKSSGLITIGNHTLSHASLPNADEAKLRNEILSANNILANNIGSKPTVFAYPFGGIGQAEKILSEGGFTAAVTTKQGLACAKLPYDLPRIRIGNTSMSFYGL